MTVTATEADNDVPNGGPQVDNPYAGASGYVNPEWSAKAAAEPGGSRVANTADRACGWTGSPPSRAPGSQSNGPMGLRAHLDAALAPQGAGYCVQFVIYNLPGRDCSALASNGELGADRARPLQDRVHRPDRGDPGRPEVRAACGSSRSSRSTRCRTWSPTLQRHRHTCATMKANGSYVEGVGYALDKLGAIPNVYNYIDAAHHGWIGWDNNFGPTAQHVHAGRRPPPARPSPTCTASSSTPPTTRRCASRTSPSTTP